MKVKSLFIISKSDLFLKTFENYFKKIGVNIFTILDATEAIHFINDLHPDVVLIKKSEYSDDEIKAISETNKEIILLLAPDTMATGFKQLTLPVNPQNLIARIESLYE